MLERRFAIPTSFLSQALCALVSASAIAGCDAPPAGSESEAVVAGAEHAAEAVGAGTELSAEAVGADTEHAAEAADQVLMAAPDLSGLTLRNQNGEPVTFHGLRGRPTLLTFIYTRCPMPEMCPATTLRFQQVQNRLSTADRARVRLVSVSFDPAYDTVEVLAEYADLWEVDDAVWTLLTGEEADVLRLAGAYGVWYEKTAEGAYRHPMYTLVLFPDGSLHQVLLGSAWDAAQVAGLLRGMADELVSRRRTGRLARD